MKIALTIAGSDSGGGAGIQADLKTFQAFGVHGTSAIVAVTAQNTRGVRAVHPIPHEVVRQQLEALADDLPPDAVKTGMLATAELVNGVADWLHERRRVPYVLDPVMVSTSGDRLLDQEALSAVLWRLCPIATVMTPNLDEATLLAGQPVRTVEEMKAVGRMLLDTGAGAVLMKGGHLEGDTLTDLLVMADRVVPFTHQRIETTSTHGTGCTLSAAITAGLALGRPLQQAVEDALDFVRRAIAGAPGLGGGHGPLDHGVEARKASS